MDYKEWHAGSQCLPMIISREDRHIVRSALQYRIATSRTINQDIGMFAAWAVSARTVHRRLQQRSLSARQSLFRLSLTMQHRERDGDSGALYGTAGYRHNGTMSSF